MKKILRVLAVIAVVILLLWAILSLASTVFLSFLPKQNVDMFETILECEKMVSFCPPDTLVERYKTPTSDEYIGDLVYADFYAAKYNSKTLTFTIFAYEFEDSDLAQAYYKNITSKSATDSKSFSASGGFPTYRIVVVDGHKAYMAECLTLYTQPMCDVLVNAFSITLYNFRTP